MKPEHAITKRLSDEEFIKKYVECGENQSRLADSLGISQPAVSKRLRRLGPIQTDTQNSAGKAAVIVEASIHNAVSEHFTEGVESGINELRSLDKFNAMFIRIEENMDFVNDMLKQPGNTGKRKLQPHLIKLLTSLTREGRGLITDYVQAKKMLYDAKGLEAFTKVTIDIIMQYDADIRRKIYVELAKAGREWEATYKRKTP